MLAADDSVVQRSKIYYSIWIFFYERLHIYSIAALLLRELFIPIHIILRGVAPGMHHCPGGYSFLFILY